MVRLSSRSICFVALLLAIGCGKSGADSTTATVTGKITLAGGKPLPGGRIDFVSTTDPHKLGSGLIKEDGTYEATGVPLGDCKVAIENSQLRKAGHAAGAESMPGQHEANQKYVPISPKYAKPETSGLSTSVAEKTATYDVQIK